MKTALYIATASLLLFACNNGTPPTEGSTKHQIDTSIIHHFTSDTPRFVSHVQLDSLVANLSPGSNLLFTDLYPIIDTLENAVDDSFILLDKLDSLGFEHITGGRGNWENGPRFSYAGLEKDSLLCHAYKAYMYYEMDEDSVYNLAVFEQVMCESVQSKELNALAKFLSYEGGDKVHYSTFKIITDHSHTTPNDTIRVGYYSYKLPDEDLDTVQLSLLETSRTGVYRCPDYDAKLGIRPIKGGDNP